MGTPAYIVSRADFSRVIGLSANPEVIRHGFGASSYAPETCFGEKHAPSLTAFSSRCDGLDRWERRMSNCVGKIRTVSYRGLLARDGRETK